jgi:hypothetical protein
MCGEESQILDSIIFYYVDLRIAKIRIRAKFSIGKFEKITNNSEKYKGAFRKWF